MWDQTGESGGSCQILSANRHKDVLIADPRAGNTRVTHKKSTVKELLMIRRQKSAGLQDVDPEPRLKRPKSVVVPEDMVALNPFGPPTPVRPNMAAHFPPAAPGNGCFSPPEMPPPPLQGQPMTLFHWQIQQEAQGLEGVSPELLNMQDADGDTFLHIAVAQGRRAAAYVLAEKMARSGLLDAREHNGQTALQIAAAADQHLIVRDLLTRGAQLNVQDSWGRSPLHVCAEKGHFLSLQSIQKTQMPVDVEMYNYEGLTPLHVAVLSHNAAANQLRDPENTCSGVTAELTRRKWSYALCIQTLMLMGASYGTKDLKSGQTCLYMAAADANVELLGLFLDQPESLSVVNVQTFSGNTALHAVSSLPSHVAQVEAVRLLMGRGADPGARNSERELPSHLTPDGPIGEKVRQILRGKHVRRQ